MALMADLPEAAVEGSQLFSSFIWLLQIKFGFFLLIAYMLDYISQLLRYVFLRKKKKIVTYLFQLAIHGAF